MPSVWNKSRDRTYQFSMQHFIVGISKWKSCIERIASKFTDEQKSKDYYFFYALRKYIMRLMSMKRKFLYCSCHYLYYYKTVHSLINSNSS